MLLVCPQEAEPQGRRSQAEPGNEGTREYTVLTGVGEPLLKIVMYVYFIISRPQK
jgi:hypothetical protein